MLTISVYGACRSNNLINLSIDDVKDNGSFFVVFLNDNTHKKQSFTIRDEECAYSPCSLLCKYLSLRPKNTNTKRLLVVYRKGKRVSQNVGYHTISSVAKKVAEYSKLEDPERYTGHSIRRTSATMLLEGGGDLLSLKRHGGWRPSNLAEGYIADSIGGKVQLKNYSTELMFVVQLRRL